MVTAAWVCLFAPLAGAVAITLLATRISRRAAAYLSTGSVAVAFGGALVAFFELIDREREDRAVVSTAWTWLNVGDSDVGLSILVDPLSVFEMLVISGVGALIVAYSIGYMDGSDEERRYFAYMALFVFSMLLLVMASNLLLLLAGWGLVGLCSYLLIGYDHDRPAAVAAAKKAFIMNAFGDATMALALFLLIWKTGALDFAGVFAQADGLSTAVATLVALGLLGGAVAKSAQIPLHTWLPDAMEGPTPVSALIHAATMVTAGVYLIVRAHPIFEAAPEVQDLAAGIGAVTLLVAGLVALVQTDIKRVIAYSTMSQIGYMFLAAGIGAYATAMFHLMTHAFFKALLFLAAGIVIHALAGEQDMRRMGGLRRALPRTYWAFVIGGLALAGIPPLAGFFSKDAILAAALDGNAYEWALLAAGVVGAFLTGLYTFRMVVMVFHWEASPYVREHLHVHDRREGPFSMVATVWTLALLTVVGGWIGIAGVTHQPAEFLHDVAEPLLEPSSLQDWIVSAVVAPVGAAGIALAWWIYAVERRVPVRQPVLQRLLEHKLYFDEVYDWIFYKPSAWIAAAWSRWIEGPLIGGSLAGIALGAREAGEGVARAQTGFLRTYALAIAAGVAVLALVFVSTR
jgi:NADH-quinone oxidoreductase subunit L